MHSHHSHSGQFCRHARGQLEDVVREAIRRGFTTYGLSEHAPRYHLDDLYPEEAGCTVEDLADTFDAFIEEAVRLKAVYAAHISLLVGLETECIRPSGDLRAQQQLILRHRASLDYVVGSVHHVRGIPIDFDRATFERAVEASGTIRDLYVDYFDAQYAVLSALKPDVIGHFDLCRLYQPDAKLDRDGRLWSAVQRNVDLGIAQGALFEVNAAALRKGWSTPYPGEEVLQLILDRGGKLCLSDDSHGPHAVGNHYVECKAYLDRMGVRTLHYLTPAREPGQRARVTAFAGDWRSHALWTECR